MIDEIKTQILSLPEIAQWPEMAAVVQRGRRTPGSIPCWEYPLLACEAAGGTPQQALPGMAAMACLLNSIHLIDDLLDNDPKGLFHKIGAGKTANIAVAFQSAAARVLAKSPLDPSRLALAQDSIGKAGLATAFGQDLDSTPPEGDLEQAYWRVTVAKTPPLFGSALYVGALLGGSTDEVARQVEALGLPIGKLIQAGDDMTDALEVPAKPDWTSRWNNLTILYAMVAEHEEKEDFLRLLEKIDEPEALAEAQEILIRCGAVSYGCYHVIESHREALRLLSEIPLPNTNRLHHLLESLIEPARRLFRSIGIELPAELQPSPTSS